MEMGYCRDQGTPDACGVRFDQSQQILRRTPGWEAVEIVPHETP